jgi:type II secretory pathway pseudopilin PulG
MELAGQPFAAARDAGNRGYAMAALLVAMSVMAVLMSAILPVWSHMATREKEEELIFRGKQYARAIGLFQRKFANTAPPTIDVLVEQRFLRKKYKDPITNDDFQPIYANQALMQAPGGGRSAARPGQGATLSTPAQQATTLQSGFGSTGVGAQGGVIGVTSKSKDESIKVYNGRTRYNEWAFVYIQTVQRPGQPGMQGVPGGQGRQGQGQQGQPNSFGMQQGNMPGGRGGFNQPPPGFGQPNRPPLNGPRPFGSPFGNPNGNPNGFTTPNGSTTFTPAVQGPRRPGGGQ